MKVSWNNQMLKRSWLIFKNLYEYICMYVYYENSIWNQFWFEINLGKNIYMLPLSPDNKKFAFQSNEKDY